MIRDGPGQYASTTPGGRWIDLRIRGIVIGLQRAFFNCNAHIALA